MFRLETLLGAFSAFLFVLFLAIVPAVIPVTIPERTMFATSTSIAELTTLSLPPAVFPTFFATSSATTSVALASTTTVPVPKKVAPKQAPTETATIAAEPVADAEPAPAPVVPVSSDAELNAAAETVRGALVNIICYVPAGSGLHSMSGSGIIINSQGIILTNAHVAQYFLLEDRGVQCSIRSGSPALVRYQAALLYIPSSWIAANASVLTTLEPLGTGEKDFALLGITESATREPLPSAFPFIPPALSAIPTGSPVVIASYGAQFLQSAQIQTALYPTIVFGSVKQLYTFGTNTADVLALGGSAAAQEGSSGGGVATASGELAGTITTSTVTGSTDTRELNAITLAYIRDAYASDAGEPLDTLLGRSISESVDIFSPQIAGLEALLTAHL